MDGKSQIDILLVFSINRNISYIYCIGRWQIFFASGKFKVPANIPIIRVLAVGGGGKGDIVEEKNSPSGGGGGGSGYVEADSFKVKVDEEYNIQVIGYDTLDDADSNHNSSFGSLLLAKEGQSGVRG